MRVQASAISTVVHLQDRLDVTVAAETREFLHAAVAEARGDVIVDLAAVKLIDATGLGVLVGAHRKAVRDGGRLLLRNVPPRTMRLLAMTRLYRVLHVEAMPYHAAA